MILYYGYDTAEMLGVPDVNASIDKILKSLNLEYITFDKEPHCAEVLYDLGYEEKFLKAGEVMVKKFEEVVDKHGVDTILTAFGASYYAWNHIYPKFGIKSPVPVKHISTFLVENLDRLNLKSDDVKVLVHDGCKVGRYGAQAEDVRKVIRAVNGASIIEFNHPELSVRDDIKPWEAVACSGGVLRVLIPELLPHYANHVYTYEIEENPWMDEKGDVLLTTCANAYSVFKNDSPARDVEFVSTFIATHLEEVEK